MPRCQLGGPGRVLKPTSGRSVVLRRVMSRASVTCAWRMEGHSLIVAGAAVCRGAASGAGDAGVPPCPDAEPLLVPRG